MSDNALTTLPQTAEKQAPAPEVEEPQLQPEPGAEPAPAPETVDESPDPAALKAEIEALEAKKQKAREDAQYWRQQKAQARADFFRERQQPETPAEPQPPAANRPDPAKFDDYSDYVEALTEWKVENKRREWERENQQRVASTEHQQKMAALHSKINEGYAMYEDFEEIAMAENLPITETITEVLAECEMPAQVVYYLGKNRTEAIALSRMTPIAAARQIARIEAAISASPQEPAKPKKTVTAAPAPIKPVGSGPATLNKDPAKMSQKEFEQWREAQGARRF